MIAAAKSNLKAVSLELGGKSPLIVFEDADMEKTATAAVGSITTSKLRDTITLKVVPTDILVLRLWSDLHSVLPSLHPEECCG
jgi:hypothetical protein